ncbi:exonuclease-like protein [Anopheles sinensis]|uniref:Exonuclease-like protein n=1 Tax=Anopheles sinensis TaxID=74873 RepID=A0A084VCX6_ANOSI|nr:exonuclease-like protein [Anopheles sinensis]
MPTSTKVHQEPTTVVGDDKSYSGEHCRSQSASPARSESPMVASPAGGHVVPAVANFSVINYGKFGDAFRAELATVPVGKLRLGPCSIPGFFYGDRTRAGTGNQSPRTC